MHCLSDAKGLKSRVLFEVKSKLTLTGSSMSWYPIILQQLLSKNKKAPCLDPHHVSECHLGTPRPHLASLPKKANVREPKIYACTSRVLQLYLLKQRAGKVQVQLRYNAPMCARWQSDLSAHTDWNAGYRGLPDNLVNARSALETNYNRECY